MRALACLLAVTSVAACEATPDAEPSPAPPDALAIFGDGYPDAGDPCRRSGETDVTNRYLDDAADFVACPPGADTVDFAARTGGRQVGTHEGWTLFSVPVR